MRFAVTGAAGFIGSTLVDKLLLDGHEVVGIDCLLSSSYSKIAKLVNIENAMKNPNFQFIEFDLKNPIPAGIISDCNFVIHLAALPGLGPSWISPQEYVLNNITATLNLIKAANTSSLEKFVYISTSSVYGSSVRPEVEISSLKPVSPYGATKLAAEILCQTYMRSMNLPLVILRYFSVYGPRQRPDMGYNILIECGLNNKPFRLMGSGNQIRTNTFVDDVVACTIEATLQCSPGEILNVSGSELISINDVIKIISGELQNPIKILHSEQRLGEQEITDGRFDSAWERLNLKQLTPLLEGLKRQIAWQKESLSENEVGFY